MQCECRPSDWLHYGPPGGPLLPLPHGRGASRQRAHLPRQRRRPRGRHVRVPRGRRVEGRLQQGRGHRPGEARLGCWQWVGKVIMG